MPQSHELGEDGTDSEKPAGSQRRLKENRLPPAFVESREALIEFKMKKMWSVTLGRHGPTKEEEQQRRERLRELQQPQSNRAMSSSAINSHPQPVTNTLKAIKRKKEKMKRAKTFREEQQQQQEMMQQQTPPRIGSGFLNNNYIYPPPLHHGHFFPEMTGMRPSKSLGNIIRSSSAGRPPKVFPSGLSPGFSGGSGSNSSRSGSRDPFSRKRFTVALEDEDNTERERTGILGFRKSRSKPDLSTNRTYFGSRPEMNVYHGFHNAHPPNGAEQKLRFWDEVEGIFPESNDPGQMTREISKSLGNMDRVGQRLEAVMRLGAQTPSGRKSVADFSRFSRVRTSRGSGRRMANPRRLRRRFRGVKNSEDEDGDQDGGDEGFDDNNNKVNDFGDTYSNHDDYEDNQLEDVDFENDEDDFSRPKR